MKDPVVQNMNSRFVLVAVCAWISLCLLVAGWIPEASSNISSLWLLSGLAGLVSAVGLAEAIKSDMRTQQNLLENYRHAALTDGLTGLENRQAFDERITHSLEALEQQGHPISLVLVDIDHFKEVNDIHGHQTGDAVLRSVARELQDCFGARGHAARYGGEEFAVVLDQVRLNEADRLAEAFRRRVHQLLHQSQDGNFQISISAGLTEGQRGDTMDALIRRADAALYTAKKMGRDCVWVHDTKLSSLSTANESGPTRVKPVSPQRSTTDAVR